MSDARERNFSSVILKDVDIGDLIPGDLIVRYSKSSFWYRDLVVSEPGPVEHHDITGNQVRYLKIIPCGARPAGISIEIDNPVTILRRVQDP